VAAALPNAASRRNAGAGLGLSIAKGIVQAHGGRLELAARPKGTCFSVHLPIGDGE
jgi:signal transduction histidine kinase